MQSIAVVINTTWIMGNIAAEVDPNFKIKVLTVGGLQDWLHNAVNLPAEKVQPFSRYLPWICHNLFHKS